MTTQRDYPSQVEIWGIERLIPSARNARTHTDCQVAEIAGSIAAFGFMSPVLVDAQGIIIAGHGRVLAARKLQLDRVPVIVVEHLTESEKRAFAIADNKIALNAGWDEELLRVELEALRGEGMDLDKLGFSEEELQALVDGLSSPERPDEDSLSEPSRVVVSRPGDIWCMGEHRLLVGDAIDPASFPVLLQRELADMVFSDPPYSVAYHSPGTGDTIVNDDLGAGFVDFLERACANILRSVRGSVYICMGCSQLHTLYNAFIKSGGHWSTYVIWGKNNFTLGRSDYQRQFEPILYGWREGQPHFWCGARDQGDLWLLDKPHVNDLHPTMKPVELVERAVLNSSRRGDTVLDPFGGSGSTLIACEKTGRRARLIEIDPHYADVIVQRWQDFTGRTAMLEGAARSFLEMAEERVPANLAEVNQ
jgi:DNA modification methylase